MSHRSIPPPTWRRRIALRFAWWLQCWAWSITDPHDAWMIDYWDDGHRSRISRGHYSGARALARELKGKIIGHRAQEIEA